MKIKLSDNTECNVIKTFENNGIKYVIYTDDEKDEFNQLLIHASRLKEVDGKYTLQDIENDYEWDMIDDVLKEMRSGL